MVQGLLLAMEQSGVSGEVKATRGALIVIEGLDRAGKSTQCANLLQELQDRGVKAKSIRFPGMIENYPILKGCI
jgi:dTMP kinase